MTAAASFNARRILTARELGEKLEDGVALSKKAGAPPRPSRFGRTMSASAPWIPIGRHHRQNGKKEGEDDRGGGGQRRKNGEAIQAFAMGVRRPARFSTLAGPAAVRWSTGLWRPAAPGRPPGRPARSKKLELEMESTFGTR